MISEKDTPYLCLIVEPRYWEDAWVDGIQDTEGTLIPFRLGDRWHLVIDWTTGTVLCWPQVYAQIHYKVCDQGKYYLYDKTGKPLYKFHSTYVPSILGVDDRNYGDYIIMTIEPSGRIKNWQVPSLKYLNDVFEPIEKPNLIQSTFNFIKGIL